MLFALLWRIFPVFANWSPNKKIVWFTLWCCGLVDLLSTGFGKSLMYQLLLIVSKKLGRPKSGKAIIVIVSPLVALVDYQVKEASKLGLCATQLGVHNDREIMEGNFSLNFGSPESWILNPKWEAMLASAPIPRQPRHLCRWGGTRCIHGFGY